MSINKASNTPPPSRRLRSSSLAVLLLLLYLLPAGVCQAVTPEAKTTPDECRLVLAHPGTTVFGQPALEKLLTDDHANGFFRDAIFYRCTLTSSPALNLEHASFVNVQAPSILFAPDTNLKNAVFTDSNLRGATFNFVTLKGARFTGSRMDLEGASFEAADLTEAIIDGADLKDADFIAARMTRVEFHPSKLPDIQNMAGAINLHTLGGHRGFDALQNLKEAFRSQHFDSKMRDVGFALQRAYQRYYSYQCRTGLQIEQQKFTDYPLPRRVNACFLFGVRAIALDATSQFGRRPWRPIGLVFLLGTVWWVVLCGWLPSAQKGVMFSFKTLAGATRTVPLRLIIRRSYASGRRLPGNMKYAMALVVAAIFNMPFQQIEVSKWLRMVSRREFEFQTRGSIRTFLGILTLLSFYLFTLWALNFLTGALTG